MPASFKIFPQHKFALFVYSGFVTFQESMDVVSACAAHPDHRPMMRQLCDLSGVTGVENDYAKLMKTQAKMVESLLPADGELLVVFYAPTAAGRKTAEMARRSWEGLNSVIVLIQHRESEAMEILGLQNLSLAQLHQMS